MVKGPKGENLLPLRRAIPYNWNVNGHLSGHVAVLRVVPALQKVTLNQRLDPLLDILGVRQEAGAARGKGGK